MTLVMKIWVSSRNQSRSKWPRGLRLGVATARLLGLWVYIPPGAWIAVSSECCVLSDSGLHDGLITNPEEVIPNVVCLSVIVKAEYWEGPDPLGTVASCKKK